MLFYTPNIASGLLSKEESKHCRSVLRMSVGDLINVFDGNGNKAEATLLEVGTICKYQIINQEYIEPSKLLSSIAIAPPKSASRFDFMIEKMIELGINEIIFLKSKNLERSRVNEDRLQKQIIATCKQCLRYHFPKIQSFTSLKALQKENRPLMIFHCIPTVNKVKLSEIHEPHSFVYCVGPEGDFDPSELEELEESYEQGDLGEDRLRTETAAILIASWLKFNQ